MVAMMENQMLRGSLDLTRLTFYCQQPSTALAVLADIAAQAANVERTSAGGYEQTSHQRLATYLASGIRHNNKALGCAIVDLSYLNEPLSNMYFLHDVAVLAQACLTYFTRGTAHARAMALAGHFCTTY